MIGKVVSHYRILEKLGDGGMGVVYKAEYQSASDPRAEAKRLQRDSTPARGVASPRDNPAPPRRHKKILFVGGAAVGVAVAAVWVALSWRSTPPAPALQLLTPRQITSATEVEGYPSWRPDGTQVAYESNQNGNWDIWVTQVSGGRAVNLTEDHEGEDRFPSWSPDGSQIAFYSDREGSGYFVMPALGGTPRKIAPAPPAKIYRRDGPPAWSPDGRRVAYATSARFPDWHAEIVSLQNGDVERLALPGPAVPRGWHLTWSPDGQRIIFQSDREGGPLWWVPAGGGEAQPFLDGHSPVWSADGQTVYFVARRNGRVNLYSRDSGTRIERQLSDFVGRPGFLLSLDDTDGEYLYFTWREDRGDLWVMDVSTADSPSAPPS